MRCLAVAIVLPLLAAMPAAAQERCADLVDRLAASQDTPAQLPSADGGGTTTTDKLAQSGGVLKPPETAGRTPTIQPSNPDSAMPTAPAIEPQTGSGQAAPPATAEATLQAQVGSLLAAARAAAGRGDETECRRNLGQAMALIQD